MKIANRQQVLVFLAGAAVALFLLDRLVITTLTSIYKTRSTAIAELQKKVDNGRSLIQREASLRSRWEYMRANTLPVNNSAAEQQVLKNFDRWSENSRISVLSISPQWKRDADDYMSLECRVEATGNLGALADFIYQVEKDPVALKLQALEISSRDNDGQQLALGLQVSGLVLTPKER